MLIATPATRPFKQGDIVEFVEGWMSRSCHVEAIFLKELPDGQALVSCCGFFGPDSDDPNALQPIDHMEVRDLAELEPCLNRWPYDDQD